MITSPFTRFLALAALFFLGSLATGSAVTLLPQEQAIATYLTTSPYQGRPTMILDPIIEGVARARAADMAHRNYFSHVNPDGIAANYLLRQAGYQLPASWPTTPDLNYVESIAAGYSNPSDTWVAWMNSPPHKEHLLAQNSFFATETHYGVGYYFDASSTYEYYWVVITAPPEPVEIMSPATPATVTTPSVDLAGTADPTTNPASIQFRIENSAGIGAYQPATGTATWSGTAAGLAPGPNVIRVESLDASGNKIAQTTITVTYVVQGTMTVSVSGSGSVTPGFAGITTRNEGEPVTIKATPAAGSVFSGWTGSVVSGSATLTVAMQDGMNLQANFVPNPFPAVSGGYYGLLTTDSGAQNGLVKLSLGANGLFTGKVQLPGIGYSIRGTLDSNGDATITIPRPGQDPLVVTIQADLTGGSGQITGTVSDDAGSFSFDIGQSSFNARTNAAPQAGRYTLVLASNPSTTGTSVPQGSGYATVVVSANGTATVAGCLADGTPYSASGVVANDGTLAIYCVPAGAPAGSSLNGLLTFRSTTISDVDGTLAWTKASKANAAFYPAGFSTQLPAVGSAYVRPGTGVRAMVASATAVTAGFSEGNLSQPLEVPVVVSQANKATTATSGSANVSLTINPVTGAVTGTFETPNGNVSRAVRGVVLQKQNAAYGYFRGVTQYGDFSLTQD